MVDRSHILSWLTDMDGVLWHEGKAIPGAQELINHWREQGTPHLVLTNNSIYTPRDLSARLKAGGLNVEEGLIYTSAMATADILNNQQPRGKAYVIGEAGLTQAMYEIGYVITEVRPDFVVLGETRNLSFDNLTKAIRLIDKGARFIATNPDPTGPSEDGPLPATGSVAALITKATGKNPYIVGKPNPMMFRSAMRKIDAHSETTAMIGDRMDTDVVAGIEAGLHTILVRTGISDDAEIAKYPFRPTEILDSVADQL
ncbi:MAG: HAD-IIA family hydrolase [Aquiluna sp.]